MSVASSGDVQFAFYSSNVICADSDEERLEQSVAVVAKTIRNAGYSARIELSMPSTPGVGGSRGTGIAMSAKSCCTR
jgi:CagE, TrbE, VirB family, component of type IV transporter system